MINATCTAATTSLQLTDSDGSAISLIINVMSTVAGYAVVAGAAGFQLPQIATILRTRNAEGISIHAYFIETFTSGILSSWGIAFGLDLSTYGDNLLAFVQLVTASLLIGYYQHRMRLACAVIGTMVFGTVLLSLRMLPMGLAKALNASNVIVVVAARLPQVCLSYRRQSTGKLSLPTVSLVFAGALVRVLTTMVDVTWEQGKLTLLVSYGAATLLNIVMMLQFWWYRSTEKPVGSQRAHPCGNVTTSRVAIDKCSCSFCYSGGGDCNGNAGGGNAISPQHPSSTPHMAAFCMPSERNNYPPTFDKKRD